NTLMHADEMRLQQISDVGPVVARQITAFFHEPHNQKLIQELMAAGIHWPINTQKSSDLPLKNKTFVITGTLSSMSRDAAREKIILLAILSVAITMGLGGCDRRTAGAAIGGGVGAGVGSALGGTGGAIIGGAAGGGLGAAATR